MQFWYFSAFVLVALATSSCVTDGLSSARRTNLSAAQASISVAAGRTTRIDQYSFITSQCTEVPGVSSRVTRRADYGTVSIQRGRDYSPFPAGNSSARCNSQRVPVWVVLYSPTRGYAGSDSFSYRKTFPDGRAIDVDVNVDVR